MSNGQTKPAPLSEVMTRLQQGVEGIKRATLARVKHPKQRIAEYAAETVSLLGEIEAAMANASGRIAELEGVDYFTPGKPKAATARAVPSLSEEPEAEEEPTEREGLEEPFEREPDPDTEVNGELSADALTAIAQHVEASAAHEAAMEEFIAAQQDLASARPGNKRLATQRAAAAQAKIIETWTAKEETYNLQKLLADRARPGV